MYNQISILRSHLYKATSHGADFHELCRRMKITPDQLNNGEGHLPYEPNADTDFWTHAIELTGDPALGLHMGEQPDNGNAFGMLGMLAGACKTMKEALETICRYNDTLTGVFKFSFEESPEEFIFYLEPHPLWEQTNLESARQAVDMSLAGILRAFHEATGKKIFPKHIRLKYTKRFQSEYQRILNAPVTFNDTRNCFVFSQEDVAASLNNYDESLYAVFNNLLRKKQERVTSRQSIADRIRHMLISHFNGQEPHIDMLASHLCMTTRTLQRKLSEEGTSYRTISNQLRRELAEELIKSGKSKKDNIAALLGYSDVSTFQKAYKSWAVAAE